jgi:hypothetical protein
MPFFWLFSLAFSVFALYILIVGVRGLLTHKPIILPARHMFWLVVLCFLPSLILIVPTLFDPFASGSDYFLLFPFVMNGLVLTLLWKQMSGYLIFGVTDDSFRAALHGALAKLGLPFEESISRMHLPSLNADLQAAVQSWIGVAQVRIKQRQHHALTQHIAAAMRDYFKTDSRPINPTAYVFYTITGVLFLMFAVYFGIITWHD